MVNACLEIKTTRDIAHRNRSLEVLLSKNLAPRYADPETQGDLFEYSEARLQDTKNRQNSIEIDDSKTTR